MRRARVLPTITAACSALAIVIALAAAPTVTEVARPAAATDVETPNERGGSREIQEQQDSTAERLSALDAARAAGTTLHAGSITSTPAPGWIGAQPLAGGVDDWEPALAADPSAPYVYLLGTRYGVPKPCKGNCPTPYIALAVSNDGGLTWGESHALCACKGSGQFDPVIDVASDTGEVDALFMRGFNVVFIRSTDHGQTWSRPVNTYGNVAWTDKPAMAVSPDGRDVYVSFNGPTGGDPYAAVSHDRGRTWTQSKIVRSKRYYFAYDATVLSEGTVIFSEGSLTYTGPAASPEGEVWQHAFISHDAGATWSDVVVDRVPVGEPCVAEGCGPDFYLGHSGVSADARDKVFYVYDGATTDLGTQQIWVRTSSDAGATWSSRTSVSDASEEATSPSVAALGHGDVRLWYMQTANGNDEDAWNVWYRSSANGGATWSDPVKISDATTGAGYITTQGFLEVYGDYGDIAIASDGATIAAWGEGFSWTGPGNVWVNRQR